MAAKPIVDGIAEEHKDDLKVIHLNVQDPSSQPLMKQYGFQYTPTFIFLDGSGSEVWRTVGAIDPERVSRTIESLD